MKTEFWQQRWERNEIAFHESAPNSLLVKNFKGLKLTKGSHVFLPLCGKALDISWLLSKGCKISGAELSKLAVEQLFVSLSVEPKITIVGKMSRYSATNIDIHVGDIFDLAGDLLGSVDAVYDRAALVALPEKIRGRYVKHLLEITAAAPQLLITFEYNQNLMDGPPFSISSDEVDQQYGDVYKRSLLESVSVPGGLKGKCDATENIWLLTKGF